MNLLQTVQPQGLNAIQDGGWEEVEMAVDSGASETVINEDMVMSAELREGAASRRGMVYQVANGEKIPNLGEKKFSAWTEEGVSRNIKAQVCSVNQALLSVKKVVDVGHRVVFEKGNSYIEDVKNREKIHLTERGGMYFIKLWTKSRSGF